MKMEEKIKGLLNLFESEPSVILAFLFGSRSKGRERNISDWDVGVYFKTEEYMEIESDKEYPGEDRIFGKIVEILKTDDVDFVVLNRARPSLVYNVLRTGRPIVIKDRKLYLDLLCKVSYEAMDWWDFVADYYKISERAKSLSPEDRARVLEYLRFLENEFNEIGEIKKFTMDDYFKDSFKRKIVERWIENLVMSALDIAKVILASERREIPQTYKDTLKIFCSLYIDSQFGEKFSWFASMRNILVHEYLDIKWKRIQRFINEAEELFPLFINRVKEIVS